jgi:hypothetical protein
MTALQNFINSSALFQSSLAIQRVLRHCFLITFFGFLLPPPSPRIFFEQQGCHHVICKSLFTVRLFNIHFPFTNVCLFSEIPANAILELFGKTFFEFCQDSGYDKILQVLGATPRDFLQVSENKVLASYCWRKLALNSIAFTILTSQT